MSLGKLVNLSVITPCTDLDVMRRSDEMFQRTFPDKSIISIGSFVRKIPSIMVNLCNIVNDLWVIVFKFDTKTKRFRFIIKGASTCITYEIICAIEDGVNYDGAMEVLNQSFTRDKMAKHPVSYLKAEIESDTTSYVFEKKLLNANNDIAVWTMCRKKLPWYKRLFGRSRSVFKDVPIVSSKVLEYKL